MRERRKEEKEIRRLKNVKKNVKEKFKRFKFQFTHVINQFVLQFATWEVLGFQRLFQDNGTGRGSHT